MLEPLPLYDTPAKSVKEVLERADALLSSPERWLKGSMAKNAMGKPLRSSAKTAVCLCIGAAIQRANPGRKSRAAIHLLNSVMRDNYVMFNDAQATTFPKLKRKLAEAIRRAS